MLPSVNESLQETKRNRFNRRAPSADCDIVGKVNGVCFTYSKEGRPSGEAFIELKTAEDFKNALAKDRKYMGHRYIEGKASPPQISYLRNQMELKIDIRPFYFYSSRYLPFFFFFFWCSVQVEPQRDGLGVEAQRPRRLRQQQRLHAQAPGAPLRLQQGGDRPVLLR